MMVPVDDGFGIMVVSGCSSYVTEPVDVVVGCDWSCAVGSGCVHSGGHVVCMCIILCGVDVIISNAFERYASCVMVVRAGPRSMAVDGCMLVPVCIVFVFRICVYDGVCVCTLVCLCACIYPHMYVCVSICVC